MEKSGVNVMYKLKPVFQLPDKIELPTCMYSVKNVLNLAANEPVHHDTEIVDMIKDKEPLKELTRLEKRWDAVLEDLNALVKEVKTIKHQIERNGSNSESGSCCQINLDEKAFESLKVFDGAVINANPLRPPYSLLLIKKLCNNFITFSTHLHSTVSSLPEKLSHYFQSEGSTKDLIKISLIWKSGCLDSELVLNPVKQLSVRGEVNILRYLGRLGLNLLHYPLDDVYQTIEIDSVLDICHRLQHTQATKELSSLYRNLNAKLGRNNYFGGENMNISDFSAWSVLKQLGVNASQDLTPNMAKWYTKMDGMLQL